MMIYEVTFKSKPYWYTGYAKARSKNEAVNLIRLGAKEQGFKILDSTKYYIEKSYPDSGVAVYDYANAQKKDAILR